MIPQLKCFDHPDQDIVMVNLTKDVKGQHRTLCLLCMEKIELGLLCSIQNIPIKIQEFAKTEFDRYHPQIKTISKIRNLVATLREKSNMFQDVISAIDDLSIAFNMGLKAEYIFYEDTFLNITRSKLEDLGDILSCYKISEARKNMPDFNLIGLGNKLSLHFQSFINELRPTENQIQKILKKQQLKTQSKKETFFKQVQVYQEQVGQEILKPIPYQLTDDQVKQEKRCNAVAFNKEGSIMVAGCGGKIKVWRLDNGQLKRQLKVLKGHTNYVNCLVFSKKVNWFASGGSSDNTIRCWKDIGKTEWRSSQPQKVHRNWIYCILLNQDEDQLISSSADKSIKIWKINQENNQISYDYSLDKYTDYVYCISLNESETTLVSCSSDKQILIWGIGENRKWEYKYPIAKSADDYGYRICFINDNIIAWQQQSNGFIHIFKFESSKFFEKPVLKIELGQVGSDGQCLFPSVFNKSKQVLIQKHNKHVYIIRLSNDGNKFNIEQEPIDCSDSSNYGGLTADGQHLVIWNEGSKQFKVYRLKYE